MNDKDDMSDPTAPPSSARTLAALSPLDGRYADKTADMRELFSEFALIRRRVEIELRWLRALAAEPAIGELPPLNADMEQYLQQVLQDFSLRDGARIKEIERRTRHDVKAVEYFLKEAFAAHAKLRQYGEFLHFGCTSEDINNLCHALQLREARERLLLPALTGLGKTLTGLARTHADRPMLGRTHGQPASPTTLGKEFAVYVPRLRRQRLQLAGVRIAGKINGAVGNYSAHLAAYPQAPWPALARSFVEGLGLHWNPCTTQIEPHDYMAEYFHAAARCNVILIDCCRDIWGYLALGYLCQQSAQEAVGSSTMPHKVNPMDFENAEGNLGLANALLGHLAETLPVSRWQRDLADSTRLRNVGAALAHALLAYRNLQSGLGSLEAVPEAMTADLEGAWQVLAEPVQTVMRRHGLERPYEKLKEFSRGRRLGREELHAFIRALKLPEDEKRRLLELTPERYLGNAPSQARKIAR